MAVREEAYLFRYFASFVHIHLHQLMITGYVVHSTDGFIRF